MRRIAIIALAVCGVLAAVLSTGAGNGDTGQRYSIVFDNASGLVELADFRVGGVTVGRIEGFDVAPKARAKVDVSISDSGFGSLRTDAFCKIAQQSLIGEYYIECEPGTKGRPLEDGATIPIEQTASPIAADLVQNVMRRPYRERLSIILSELGAGFAARGDDVNDAIRRGVPALQETNRVLKILADNRRVIRRLADDSGAVLSVLGDRRRDVSRFVSQAGETASVTAERREALQATFRRFPGFLAEFTPTIRDLGTAARGQTPALADLRAAAPSVVSLLQTLPSFARASEPAVTSLAAASRLGRTAVREAESTVEELDRFGSRAPEPANNLRFILKDLDDRGRAVEKDPDSPGGQGYTGLEAILQYPFDQSLAFNIFDTRGYILKLSALINECTAYTSAEDAKADPERYARCAAGLGPNQPGVTTPDPTATGPAQRRTAREGSRKKTSDSSDETPQQPSAGGGAGDAAPAAPESPVLDLPSFEDLPELLEELPDLLQGNSQLPNRTPLPPQQQRPAAPSSDLLDFLLGA